MFHHVRKCLDFCRQLEVKVTGVVENMSGFVCPDCGHRHDLFSSGGGARMADAAGLPLLAQLPLDPAFLQQCDQGNIAAAVTGPSEIAAGFKKIAAAVLTADDAPAAAAE